MGSLASQDRLGSLEDEKVVRIERALLRRLRREPDIERKVLIWKEIDERLRQRYSREDISSDARL